MKTQPTRFIELIKHIFENKIESCNDLFNLFPGELIGGYRITKAHLFEALWKIIFLLNLDNLTDGYNRQFKVSIESEIGEKENNNKSIYEYLNSSDDSISKINSGSASGICDLYFTIDQPSKPKDKEVVVNTNACERTIYKPNNNDIYLFTSKFYKHEKSIAKYDITEIALNAKEIYADKKYKIVCLVNNKVDFKLKLIGSSKDVIKKYIDSDLIYDYNDLNLIYYPKFYKWLQIHFQNENKAKNLNINLDKDWKKILADNEPIINISDILRFHQRYVVEYTDSMITPEKPGRFIWGAVARSGKTYMIGGLVAKRRPKYVILVLGAINETKSQFIQDLFKKYTDLKYHKDTNPEGYSIIDFQVNKNPEINKELNYVIVISQESLRLKVVNDNKTETDPKNETVKMSADKRNHTKTKRNRKDNPVEQIIDNPGEHLDLDEYKPYGNTVIDKIKQLLLEPNKIVFFDEIHQGSGSDSMQFETIRFFYKPEYPKPTFIMVTATYAKPMAKYGKQIDDNDAILVEWNYEMMMKMKKFNKQNVTIESDSTMFESNQDTLIDKTSDFFEQKMKILEDITKKELAAGKSCDDIAGEYEKNPELVYLLPTLKQKCKHAEIMDDNYNITDGVKQINIKQDLKQIFKLNQDKQSFEYSNAIHKLLKYIYDEVYSNLLNTGYNYVANGEGNVHSQLWFLPTTMKNEKVKGAKKTEDPAHIITPMLKNLGIAIVEHELFTNFNVCIVHSGDDLKDEHRNELNHQKEKAEKENELAEKEGRKKNEGGLQTFCKEKFKTFYREKI